VSTQPYYVDGVRVPSVTTILSLLDKPALKRWASNMAIEAVEALAAQRPITGEDCLEWRRSPPFEVRREKAADAGTYAHAIVAASLKGEPFPDAPLLMPQEDRERAADCAGRVVRWLDEKGVKVLSVEQALTCPVKRFGGTHDLVCERAGITYIADLKTGKGAYDEVLPQLGAYRHLVATQTAHKPTHGLLLHAPLDGPLMVRVVSQGALSDAEQMFFGLREVYDARKRLSLKDCEVIT
jgi:hypothetical protein